MENREKKPIWIIIAISLVLIIIIGAVTGIIYYNWNKKTSKGNATIELSSSVSQIYLGGRGKINAVLKYDDGSIEAGKFSFESDSSLLTFLKTDESNYTGEFEVRGKDDDSSFASVVVTVTVRSEDKSNIDANTVSITVTDAIKHTIEFFNGGTKVSSVDIYEGYSLVDMNAEIPMVNPSTDYDTEWYESETDKLYEINAESKYYRHSSLSLYARCRLNKPLVLIDELNNTTTELTLQKDLYFGEEVNAELQNKLEEKLSPTAGWNFVGWYPDINSSEIENGITDGKLYATTSTLYAKWTSEINFVIDSHLGSLDKTKTTVVYNGRVDCPSISYVGQTTKGKDDIKFDGWYTQPYGEGEKLNPSQYTFKETGRTFYDSTLIQVYFKDILNKQNVIQPITVIYGNSVRESRAKIDNVGNIPVLGDNAWKHVGWEFIGRDNACLEIVTDKNKGTFIEQLENFTYIYSDDRPQLNGSIELESVWELDINYNTKTETSNITETLETNKLKLGNTLDLPRLSQGSWNAIDWFTDNTYSNQINNSGAIASNGEYFLKLVQDHAHNGVLPIYAKWITKVELVFGNEDNSRRTADVVYGQPMGQNLPIPTGNDDNDKEVFGKKAGYNLTDRWQNELGEVVAQDTYNYPLLMDKLFYQWEGETYKIYLDHNGGNSTKADVYVTMGQPLQTIVAPKLTGKSFSGYFTERINNGRMYYQPSGDNAVSNGVWETPNAEGATLYARWDTDTYTVIFNGNGGVSNIPAVNITHNGSFSKPNGAIPTRTGFVFKGFYDNSNGEGDPYFANDLTPLRQWDKTSGGTLYAGWDAYPIKITSVGAMNSIKDDTKITVSVDFATGSSYSYSVSDNDSHLNIKYGSGSKISGSTFTYTISRKDKDKPGTIKITVKDDNSKAEFSNNYDYSTSGGCFVAGTLITMGDGTQQKIENVKVGDMVQTWDFLTGQIESMPVCQFYRLEDKQADLLSLKFDDGTAVDVVYSHGFFDATLNNFVFIDVENYNEYIGHEFVKFNGQEIEKTILISVEHTIKDTEFYAIITACNLNAFAENLMTLTKPYIEGTHTYFEFGENLMYDQEKMQADIEQYGLYSYEEACSILKDMGFEYFPYEYYVAVNVQYYKILIGKGVVTFDDIAWLVADLAKHG